MGGVQVSEQFSVLLMYNVQNVEANVEAGLYKAVVLRDCQSSSVTTRSPVSLHVIDDISTPLHGSHAGRSSPPSPASEF
jgi:hypothetical protein